MDPRTRAFLHDEMRHLVEALASAHRLTLRVERLGPRILAAPWWRVL